jgi:Protein of unknown function (DUF3168)
MAAGLQAAVYARLTGAPELLDLVGDKIYDAPLEAPADPAATEHVTLGEEIVRPWNTKTSEGAVHDFDVTVHSRRDGFGLAKRIAGAVCAALIDAPLAVEGGRLVALRFLRAKAVRGQAPEKRRIALRFRAVLDEDN